MPVSDKATSIDKLDVEYASVVPDDLAALRFHYVWRELQFKRRGHCNVGPDDQLGTTARDVPDLTLAQRAINEFYPCGAISPTPDFSFCDLSKHLRTLTSGRVAAMSAPRGLRSKGPVLFDLRAAATDHQKEDMR